MLDLTIIKAVSLDLDDTLWPIWPTIKRAEAALNSWLNVHAPMTAALYSNIESRQEIRDHVVRTRPELKYQLSELRREAIRTALERGNDNPDLAEKAFEVFFAARQQVTLYDDALQALEFFSSRYPLIALSNGNADIAQVGLSPYFRAHVSAQAFGVGKPDPRIFHAAAGAVDVLPEQVLHVGDDAAMDVLGALNAGMQAVWVNRTGQDWDHPPSLHQTVTSLTDLCELFLDFEQTPCR
jgi:2-haloalkanoic acid dehalogenase type II